MMPVSIFVSRLGITDLVNKIKTHTNLTIMFQQKKTYFMF
jgi:hypothetical protein